MNIYLDFEATQFKENIIAIGAHCKYGDFDCLGKPPKGDRITNFITELTGISKDMVDTALDIETAFWDFHNWVYEVSSNGPTFFHVYGDMDKVFMANSLKHIQNPYLKRFVENLTDSLIDDTKTVKRFFHSNAIMDEIRFI